MIIAYMGQELDLTSEEYKILSHLIRHPGRVFSKEQITAIVDEDIVILPKSVNMRMQRIRHKLKVIAPDKDSLITVHGMGFKLV